MRTDDLKKVAYKFIITQRISSLPVDGCSLLGKLNIDFKPIDSVGDPILIPDGQDSFTMYLKGSYTMFFNPGATINSYFILRELAAYVLKESGYNEITREVQEQLALLLMAPPCVVRELNIAGVPAIHEITQVPAHIIRKYIYMYEDKSCDVGKEDIVLNLFDNYIKSKKHLPLADAIKAELLRLGQSIAEMDEKSYMEEYKKLRLVYINDSSGAYYHEYDCKSIENDVNVNVTNIEQAERANYKPCPNCIK